MVANNVGENEVVATVETATQVAALSEDSSAASETVNKILRDRVSLPKLKSLAASRIEAFLKEFDDKCRVQGINDPATCAAADLKMWIEPTWLDVLALDRPARVEPTYAVIRAELEAKMKRKVNSAETGQTWVDWMGEQAEKDKVRLTYYGPGRASAEHAYDQVRGEAIELCKAKNREFPDPKTRAGRFDRSQWLAILLPQPYRLRFTKALRTERCSIPGLTEKNLREEPDGATP